MKTQRVKCIEWDGITKSKTLRPIEAVLRKELGDFAKRCDWGRLLQAIGSDGRLANSTRPDGRLLYAPLHQAAHGGAPIDVVKSLLKIGAWRTLRTAQGERPLDIALRRNQQHLIKLLQPVLARNNPSDVLARIQSHFHEVICGRVEDLVNKEGLRLPELEPLLEYRECQVWFAVPGMYGGFKYWLEGEGKTAKLISVTWSRVLGVRDSVTKLVWKTADWWKRDLCEVDGM